MILRRDTVTVFAGNLFPLVIAAWAIPHLLTALGNQAFGILSLMWALIGYFGLFDLGVGRALTFAVSRALMSRDDAAVRSSVSAGIALTCITGLLGASVVLAATFFLSSHEAPARLRIGGAVHTAFLIIAFAVIPTTMTSALRGWAEGYGSFGLTSTNRILFGALMFGLPALAITFHGPSLIAIAAYLAAGRVLVMLHMLGALWTKFPRSLQFRLQDIRALLGYGSWVTISSIVSPLMVYGDRFIVSAAVGVQALPAYAIPQEGLQRLLIFPGSLTSAMFPKLTSHAFDDAAWNTYSHYLRRICLWMGLICGLAAVATKPVMTLWISRAFAAESLPIACILCAGLWFNGMAQLPMTFLQALGKPKVPAQFHLGEVLPYAALAYLLSARMGLIGAAIAWSARVTVDFALLHSAVRRFIRRARG